MSNSEAHIAHHTVVDDAVHDATNTSGPVIVEIGASAGSIEPLVQLLQDLETLADVAIVALVNSRDTVDEPWLQAAVTGGNGLSVHEAVDGVEINPVLSM